MKKTRKKLEKSGKPIKTKVKVKHNIPSLVMDFRIPEKKEPRF